MENKNKIFSITNILLVILIVILVGNNFNRNVSLPVEREVIIPESKGSSEKVFERVNTIPIYVNNTETIVDKEYYEMYLKLNDSVKELNAYLDAIQIKESNNTIVDNDTIKIDSYSKVRGTLLSQSVNYTIKESKFSYKPEYIKERPRLSLLPLLEVGINTNSFSPTFKGGFGIQLKSGDIFSTSIDSKSNVFIGYNKSFTIVK